MVEKKAKECRWLIEGASRKTPKPADFSIVDKTKFKQPVAQLNNPAPNKPNNNTGNNYNYWFWAAEKPVTEGQEKKHSDKWDRCIDDVKKKGGDYDPYAVCTAKLGTNSYETGKADESKQPDLADTEVPIEDEVNQMLVDNPGVNASTFYNLIKSKGMKITREADQATANTPVLRAQSAAKGAKKKNNKSGIYIPASKKKDVSREAAIIAVTANHKQSMRESSGTAFGNISTTLQCRFREGKDLANPTSANKFRVVLIQEGLGNLKDGYYYTKDALKSAVPVFEGKKMYVDHPDRLEEETRPERSVRDIMGHFEDVEYLEGEDGVGMLEADLCIMPDEPFQWVRALMRHATDYSKKFPDKDFVGLSINASGDADPMESEEFLKQNDLPKSTLPKIAEAIADGLSQIKIVKNIADAVSCDLVTEAGARGKVLKMLEAEMKKEMEKKKEGKKEEMEKKEGEAHKEEEIPGKAKKAAQDDDGDDDKKKAEAGEDDAKDAKDGKDDGDDGDEDHDDADQDKELIKKMLKKHLGDEAMEDDVAHKAAKHYMAAYEAMGHDKEEAASRACEAMKMAGEAKKSMEAEDKKEAEGKKDADADSDDNQKESAVILKLKGENARLVEKLAKIEIAEHLDKKLQESKLPNSVTKKFREACKSFKTQKEVDDKFELFCEGYKAIAGEASVGYEDTITISTEKQTTAQSKESKDFADCVS